MSRRKRKRASDDDNGTKDHIVVDEALYHRLFQTQMRFEVHANASLIRFHRFGENVGRRFPIR